jgi:polyhydroxybutyrate depolymerase
LAACGDDATQQPTTGAGGAGGSASNTTSTGGTPESCASGRLGPGDHTFTLMHGGVARTVMVHVPPSGGTTEQPLVLNFHGYTSNASQQIFFSEMNVTSDAHNFVVAYPEGTPEGSTVQSWNGGALCCGEAASTMVDDVGFARAIVADLDMRACIDTRRVYSTGMSNGGFMSHRLGCEAADLVTAIAPVAGLVGIPVDQCHPSRPIPVIHFYGTLDELVTYSLADDVDNMWADRNGCTDAPRETFKQGIVTCMTRSACQGGVEVTMCSVEGGGHCWPGQPFCPFGVSTEDIEANEAMWAVFERFALP